MKYLLQSTVCSLFLLSEVFGQSVLRFTEYDEDDHVVQDSSRAIAAFDINSRIEIGIDKNALRKALVDQLKMDPFSEEIINRISALQNAAEKGLLALMPLQEALLEWSQAPDSQRSVADLRPLFSQIGDPSLRIINLAPPGSNLRKAFNRQLFNLPREAGVAGSYSILFEGALREAKLLTIALDDLVNNRGVFIQLGAWLETSKSTNPIHLPGFDTYPELGQYVVKRWNISLSDEQQEQLKSIETLANNFNTVSFKKALEGIQVTTPQAIVKIADSFHQCADSLSKKLDKLETLLPPGEVIALSDIDKLNYLISGYINLLQGLKEKYRSGNFADGAEFLIQTNDDLSQLKHLTRELVVLANNLKSDFSIRLASGPDDVKAASDDLATAISGCSVFLETGVSNLVDKAIAMITELTGFKKLNESALELGKEVMKYDISGLPDKTTFAITKTGRRQAGDKILVRIAAGDSTRRSQVLEHRRFRLFQILPHLRTIVGLIFADLPESETVDSKFQLSASYSILLKKGSRKSMGFNRIFSPGIGLNIAALDFDHNDVPEIGLGLVGSVFRDYIQGGFGYNVYRDEPYWFFGLRIPLSLSAITFNKETAGQVE